ncbi:MAG: hypothetical protein WEC15_02110 [Flavobacteriales bacterium]
MDHEFPIFRRTANGQHFYLIEAEDVFTEIQLVGRRAVLHHVKASMYPELVRIQDMIRGDGGRYLELRSADWSELLHRYQLEGPARPIGGDPVPGF